ncbi:MAG: M17 family peptidase N-terminal domain-containing protein [Acidobacteriaceae bacterium]|nr:M17 family peptidase N-terminal domain-containing protein [Acidobacteriaceae bacterium]
MRPFRSAALLAAVFVSLSLTTSAQTPKGARLPVKGSAIPVDVLVESPADAPGDLQIICLFEAGGEEPFQASLAELDTRLGGVLSSLRYGNAFRGTFGETLLITPKPGAMAAKRLLLVGLGDRDGFTAAREDFIGEVVYTESNRLGATAPTFAPTVLDGGKKGIHTGDVAKAFLQGFERTRALQEDLYNAGHTVKPVVAKLTFLAGTAHAVDTQHGLEAALQYDVRMIKMEHAKASK